MPRLPAHRFRPWIWPLLAALAVAGCWAHAYWRAEQVRAAAVESARRDLVHHVEAFELYLTRSVAQIDQLSMQLKEGWEQGGGRLALEGWYRDGMLADPAHAAIAIYDATGKLVGRAGRHADNGPPVSFVFHRDHRSPALRIVVPEGTVQANQPLVQFTRRLDDARHGYGGLVALTVDARYLTSFYNPAVLGDTGLLAVLGDAGALRLEAHGEQVRLGAGGSLFSTAPDLGGAKGGTQFDGTAFYDRSARLLSWKRSGAYPLLAVAGMTAERALAPARADWNRRRGRALWLSALIVLLGATATGHSLGLRRERRRRDEERQAYRIATEQGSDGFYLAAAVRDAAGAVCDFEVTDCNARGAFFYGFERQQLIGRRISTLDRALFGEALLPVYLAAMTAGSHEDERQMGTVNIGWGRRRITRVGDSLAITLQDVSERKSHERDVERLTLHDLLTGLPNRQWLARELPRRLAAAGERDGTLAVLLVDLDDFKQVNDTLGHGAGDRLLRMAAERIGALLRPGDRLARMGGDEFVLLVDPAADDGETAALAGRVLAALAGPASASADLQRIEASVGIAVFPRDGTDHETLLRHADIAMASGKNERKGHYRFFDPSQFVLLSARAHLKHSLAAAIDAGQLSLHYQVRVDVVSERPVSMEALSRWQHATLGMVPPSQFIPLAESSGLINRLGELVMRQACAQLAAWRAAGLPLLPVSINVSPHQFGYGSVSGQLARALAEHAVDPGLLEVEITESAMVSEQADVQAELGAIRALGVRVFVDDFGTGYSSLSQLQRLRLDGLKVDQAFTRELDRSREGRVFFQAIVSMAGALGMVVVAEGVETPRQLELLRELGCQQAQGYLLGRPVPAAAMAELLAAGEGTGRLANPVIMLSH
ncbi:EAL domain-containing protein [Oxalobacteraceae bacterium OTU3REALA1]|nr:EAL domain-containing protein [Oxalobacteraceae bacterium OTU3REALA1]